MKKTLFLWVLLCFPMVFSFGQNIDIDILHQLNEHNPSEDYAWRGVTNTIKWAPAIYVGANLTYGAIANDKTALRYSFESTLSMSISQVFSNLLKITVKRPRPTDVYPGMIHSYSYTSEYSFPSGHTSLSFAAATSMAFHAHDRLYFSVPIFVWPLSVGYSRMRLGKHFPSDVLAGILIGIASGLLGHMITDQIID